MCDDEPQIVRALRVILREAGYVVSTAATLAEGLDIAVRRPPDAAIIDLLLPDGSGIELCTELRSWSTMPIVAAHTVLRDGREVKLTPLEFKLLSALARNRGRLVTSRALLSDVWGPTYANDSPLLRTHIANLRHKIDGGGEQPWSYIQTEAGIGYRFSE